MCNWKKWILPGILATLLLTALAMMMKSASIEQDLQAKALNALSADHKWANVALDGRDLTLSGTAPSEEAIAQALKLSDDAYDVRIASSSAELLPLADPFKITATKGDNKLVLTGTLPDEAARASVMEAATAAYPGAEIVDQMTLARGAPAGFAGLAGFGLSQLSCLASGEASLTNLDLSVNGTALDADCYDKVNAALAAPLPENGKLASAAIAAPMVSEYVLNAEKTDGGIVLNGYYPDAAVRERIVAAARKATAGTVTDNLRIASGNHAGFGDLSDFSIAQLGDLSTGNVAIRNRQVSVSGTAVSPEAFDRVSSAMAGTIPGEGEVVVADITPTTVSPYTFAATSNGTSIVLDGYVPSADVKKEIVFRTNQTSGGARVIDRLAIAGGAPGGVDWLQAMNRAIGDLGRLSSGKASLNNAAYSIEGVAKSNSDYDAIHAEAANPGNGLSLASNTVTRPVVSPYVWTFGNPETGAASFSGYVPDMKLAEDNQAQAVSRLGTGSAVASTLEIGNGAPRGFEAATSVAIQTTSRLLNGKAEIRDTELMVTGEALSETAAREIRARVENGLPPGFIGKHAITVRKAADMPILQLDICQQLLTDNLRSNTIRFETAKAVITEDSFALLDRLAFVVKRCPTARVEISGHTDSDGSDSYNQGLSEERARAVMDYLARSGVYTGRLDPKGYGETRPVADNSTPEGKALNRRIEFLVIR